MRELMKEIEETLARTRAVMDEAVKVAAAAEARIAVLEQENARLQREVERVRGLATVGRRWGLA